jgi:hypothetical protein
VQPISGILFHIKRVIYTADRVVLYFTSTDMLISKVCSTDPTESASSNHCIRGFTSVMAVLKIDINNGGSSLTGDIFISFDR